MGNQPSPLESLAAFAISFAAGIVSTVALKAYADWAQRRACSEKTC